MAKSTKIIAALGAVAGLGVAAMPLATYAADPTPKATITDTINIEVEDACRFEKVTASGAAGDEVVIDENNQGTYTATIKNGEDKTFAKHEFTVFCNNSKGYTVKAKATGLNSGTDDIPYVAFASYTTLKAGANKATGAWTAEVSGGNASAVINATDFETIMSKNAAANADTFGVQYSVYVGDTTDAGSYTGTVVYNLFANE